MMDFPKIFGEKFKKNDSSALLDIERLESVIGTSLPSDYKDFLLWSDGGEGEVGDLYLSMWTLSQLSDLNSLYLIDKRMSAKFLGIGTDGGDYCFALDLRGGCEFVVVPLGALADDEVRRLDNSFVPGVEKIRDYIITGNDL
ncbi:SMI1/KNR4 family protein [Burkholderia perseverans]|uniref:SMI1/KNR4 family protein n=1 Tax=Burkholderia perseverans TaxID=2615214 RepID=UPI001FEECF4D|nr:SMI1/KNR4 family protein [Burkholderia perseverans]